MTNQYIPLLFTYISLLSYLTFFTLFLIFVEPWKKYSKALLFNKLRPSKAPSPSINSLK